MRNNEKLAIASFFLFVLLLGGSVVNAQYIGGGGEYFSHLRTPEEQLKEFLNCRVGLSIHWGPVAQMGTEISWSRNNGNKSKYDNLYKTFNPTEFDAKEWCELMQRWGLKFIAPTAKHHDGFSLWYSKVSEYDMENAALKVDIMKELKRECASHNILFGTYFSILDWYHADYAKYDFGGPGDLFQKYDDSPNMSRYMDYMRAQLKELIVDYKVKFIQFDGEWDHVYTHEMGGKLYDYCRSLDPHVLLSMRLDKSREWNPAIYAGDYLDRERIVGHGTDVSGFGSYPWQAWVTLNPGQWAWNPNLNLHSSDYIINDLTDIICDNGNYMINIGPQPDGSFHPKQIEIMDEVGAWLKKYGDAVYSTRGGPYLKTEAFGSSHKDSTIFLFVKDWNNSDTLKIPAPEGMELQTASTFDSKSIDAFQHDKTINIVMPKEHQGKLVDVVALKMDDSIDNNALIDVNEYMFRDYTWLSKNTSYTTSSLSEQYNPAEFNDLLLSGEHYNFGYAFHSNEESNPYLIIDLEKRANIAGFSIENRNGGFLERANTIAVWVSSNGTDWSKVWENPNQSEKARWDIVLDQMPNARYIKIGLQETNWFHLKGIKIFGEFATGTSLKQSPKNEVFNLISADKQHINFSLNKTADLKFEIFSMNGIKLFETRQQQFFQGSNTVPWSGKNVQGVIIIRITQNSKKVQVKKIVI